MLSFILAPEPWKSLISGSCLEYESVFPNLALFSEILQLNYNIDTCFTFTEGKVVFDIHFNDTLSCNTAKVILKLITSHHLPFAVVEC